MTALLVHVSAMIEHVPDQHCAHHELNSAAPWSLDPSYCGLVSSD